MSTTTVLGVAVFDGHARLDGRFDVTFDTRAIRAVVPTGSTPTGSDAVVDGTGGTLLPGLIDTHVHLRSADQLTALAHLGVTTAIDLGQWSPEVVTALHAAEAGADFRTSGGALAGPGGPHATIPGFPPQNLVRTGEEARAAVERRVGEGSDYVKLILEAPGGGGLEVATATAAVEAAHGHGRTVVAHATSTGAFAIAVQAGVDVLTHAPLDAPLPAALVEQILALGAVTVPTLVMMRGTATNLAIPGLRYDNAEQSVRSLHAAGAPIVAGTDANDVPGVPARVAHGSGLHDELGLLTGAGLNPSQALRSATGAAAGAFGLSDRGMVEPGRRPDLVLVAGDPTADIAATTEITGVWIAGSRSR